MAARKPDSEVGPLGVWAYNTRALLEVSDAQAAEAASVTTATIRKIEGGSNRKPSARLLHDLYRFYKQEGERLDRPVEEPPGYRAESVPVQSDVAAAIDRQTKAIENLTAAIWAALGLRPTSDDPLEQDLQAAALLGDAEAARRADTPGPEVHDEPAPQPERLPRGNGAGS